VWFKIGEKANLVSYLWFATDCKTHESRSATAKREISSRLRTVHFDATLKFNESHLVYRPITQPAYVGTPTEAIDNAWKSLMGGKIPHEFYTRFNYSFPAAVNVFVTPAEQELLGGDLWLDPETGLYMAEYVLRHSLLYVLGFSRHSLRVKRLNSSLG
jgi:hypothetical protein